MSPMTSRVEAGGRSDGFRPNPRFSIRRRWLLALLGLVAVAAVACGSEDSQSSASAPTGDPDAGGAVAAPASPSAGNEGTDAALGPGDVEEIKTNLPSDFEIGVYQGGGDLGHSDTVHFSNVVAQGKPVILNMWAGLCPPCRAEMPDLEEVHQEFKDTVILFGLDVGPFTGLGNKQDALSLIEEIGVTYPAGNTEASSVVRDYGLLGMPSTWFIRPNGEVMRKWSGAINASKLRELTQQLIAVSG